MEYKLITNKNKGYIVIDSDKNRISAEKDVNAIISLCFENRVNLLIIYDNSLSDDFFDLKTGLAGITLQKFINYNIKAAVIVTDDSKINTRFREMILESNKGNSFRVYKSGADAERWILSL